MDHLDHTRKVPKAHYNKITINIVISIIINIVITYVGVPCEKQATSKIEVMSLEVSRDKLLLRWKYHSTGNDQLASNLVFLDNK